MTDINTIQTALACGRPHCACGRVHGDNLVTHCPAHEDGQTSLSVTAKEGRLLVKCHAGCSQPQVMDALKRRDLWPKPERPAETSRGHKTQRVTDTYSYCDESGELLYQVQRTVPKGFTQRRPEPEHPGRFVYNLQGVRRVLYRLPEIVASDKGPVFIVEGEKDADRLCDLGLTATTNAGGAGKWLPEYSQALAGRHVVIVPDNDGPGRDHARKVAASLHGIAKTIRVLELPGLPEKGDVSDWLDAGNVAGELYALAMAAPVWNPAPAESLAPDVEGELLDGGKGGPNDLGLATAWAKEVYEEFAYVEGDQWWRYESGCWHYSSLEVVQAQIQHFLTRLRERNDKINVTRARVQNVVFLAKSLLGPLPLTEFDNHPEWIPLHNGVFDTRTGELLPHCPEHHLTHQAPYDYDGAAKCPRWERFLLEVMLTPDGLANSEWISILQEWFGYCLISDTSAQSAMFWVGEGQNGKGTATRVLERLVGTEYCTAVPIEQLHDPYYRASLHGKLVGLVNEPDPKAIQKNGNFFKALTGGDRIDARRPTEKVFSFVPTCRIIVSCNDLPSTRDVSRGYFRRIILIEWRYNVPNEKRDSGLDEVMVRELPGIFNWAMRGLQRWNARGRRFDVPEESAALLSDYRMSEDTLARFQEEETIKDQDGFVTCSDFYAAYMRWCKASGEHHDSAASVGRRLGKQGFTRQVRRIGKGTVRGWKGLMLSGSDNE